MGEGKMTFTFLTEFRTFPVCIHKTIRKEHDTSRVSTMSQSKRVT
jgi:hypothetical protein